MRGANDARMNVFSVITQRYSFAAHIESSITQTCNKIHTDTLERKKNASDSLEFVRGEDNNSDHNYHNGTEKKHRHLHNK